MAAAATEPTILFRLERLDIMMGYLEEIRGSRFNRSSYASTTSSGTATSDGGTSSMNSSPRSVDKGCRPIGDMVAEIKHKGSLIDRVEHLEIRLLKLGTQLEEEIEMEKKKEEEEGRSPMKSNGKTTHKKGLKRLLKSCMKSDLKNKERWLTSL